MAIAGIFLIDTRLGIMPWKTQVLQTYKGIRFENLRAMVDL